MSEHHREARQFERPQQPKNTQDPSEGYVRFRAALEHYDAVHAAQVERVFDHTRVSDETFAVLAASIEELGPEAAPVLAAVERVEETIDHVVSDALGTYTSLFHTLNIREETLRAALQDQLVLHVEFALRQPAKDRMMQLQERLQRFQQTLTSQLERLRSVGDTLNQFYADAFYSQVDQAEQERVVEAIEGSSLPIAQEFRRMFDRNQRYDSRRLIEMIDELSSYSAGLTEDEEALIRASFGEEGVALAQAQAEKEKQSYEYLIRQLQTNLLPMQHDFERRVWEVLHGRDVAKLPTRFFEELEASLTHEATIADRVPYDECEDIYFPVGISKDIRAWEQVWNGEMKATKPIDMYAYLFWLNNLDRPVTLVVADAAQKVNYMAREGQDPMTAAENARKVGIMEGRMYESIINRFGLNNIRIEFFDDVFDSVIEGVSREKAYAEQHGVLTVEYYHHMAVRFADHPMFRQAFDEIVQQSATMGERDIQYGALEIGFILARGGTKVSHLREARYDVVAWYLKNLEDAIEAIVQMKDEERAALGFDALADVEMRDLLELPEDTSNDDLDAKTIQLAQLASSLKQQLRDELNRRKGRGKAENNRVAQEYYSAAMEQVSRISEIRVPREQAFGKKEKRMLRKAFPVSYPITVPKVTARQVGWRNTKNQGQEKTVIKFREPYSTYFYEDPQDAFVYAAQVIASPEGQVGGKILTLDARVQQQYAETVLRPLLTQFFRSIESLPADAPYFAEVDASKEEIRRRCFAAESMSDVLEFIQEYIVSENAVMQGNPFN